MMALPRVPFSQKLLSNVSLLGALTNSFQMQIS